MPLKLVPPTPGRTKVYRVRGTYLGRYVDRSTETGDKAKAERFRKAFEAKIERGEFSAKPQLTFADAAVAYMKAGGEVRFMAPLVKHLGKVAAKSIDQAMLDEAASLLYPNATPSTRSRQVYAPVSAVLKRAGVQLRLKHPIGAFGNQRTVWLRPEEFERLVLAALQIDKELAILFVLLCYTGLRLGEALRIRCSDINLETQEVLCGKTKNGLPRLAYLPDRIVAVLRNHPRGLDRDEALFGLRRGGQFYVMANAAYAAARVEHGGAPFHVLRHTYGSWMTRAGADLVATKAWRSASSARIYQHFDLHEEARKAALLPGAKGV